MSAQTKLALISLVLLLSVGLFAYTSFDNFKPKDLQPLEEVHGSKTVGADSTISGIPFPKDYILLGTTDTGNSKQITFETPMTTDEVQNFYRVIFTNKGWDVEYEGKSGIFLTTGYRREKQEIRVVSSALDDLGKSVVSIELTT